MEIPCWLADLATCIGFFAMGAGIASITLSLGARLSEYCSHRKDNADMNHRINLLRTAAQDRFMEDVVEICDFIQTRNKWSPLKGFSGPTPLLNLLERQKEERR